MTYKNHEGYPDPTQGQAINGVRWEELQRMREEQYGIKRGDILTLQITRKNSDGTKSCKSERVRVLSLYQHHVLVENQLGVKNCYQYWFIEHHRK